jgi:hypothetical protein
LNIKHISPSIEKFKNRGRLPHGKKNCQEIFTKNNRHSNFSIIKANFNLGILIK